MNLPRIFRFFVNGIWWALLVWDCVPPKNSVPSFVIGAVEEWGVAILQQPLQKF